MNKRFLLIASVLVILSLISAGIGSARTVTITPRDPQRTADLQTTSSPETPSTKTSISETTPQEIAPPADTSKAEDAPVTYVLNTNTKKFHRPDCTSVTQMKEQNRRSFSGTRGEAIAAGYSPCQNCDP